MSGLMLTPDGLLWIKCVRHCNCADKYILIEHSDLVGFCYDLSDTQDELRFWGKGIFILW